MAGFRPPPSVKPHALKTFELDTLKIRLADAEMQRLDLHQRIHRALSGLILDGALASGMKLPASRRLAASLGIARDTVENAYVQLHRDGFIIRREGSGSYVSPTLGTDLEGVARRRLRRQAEARHDPAGGEGLSRRGRMVLDSGGIADQRAVRPFVTGLPETCTFPTEIWERLQRRVIRDHRDDILLHGDPQGAEALREAIAAYLTLERGAGVAADQILVLSSTRQALYLCAQLLVDAGGPILMENPGYFGARKAFEAAEARIVPIPVDARGIRTDLVRADQSGAACVYVTPSHQYPTGATLSLDRRIDLIAWAAETGGWIIEDDYDSEFHYDGLPTACVQGLDRDRRTIYIGTFAKTLYPGLRLGYMALPPTLVEAFTRARSIIDGHTPQLQQLTLARFMADGHYNAHIRAMRKLYAGRRQIMLDAIARHLDGIATATRPPGGLQIPCILEPGWPEADTIARAAAAGLVLPGLGRLHIGPGARPGWLLGYASLAAHEIEAAMLRLGGVLRQGQASGGDV
ncbi:PLP-dependent aminotransferase family protein [Tistrella mobilis]|uniref:MocR-like pyridoxine biosynthesis transcription factor PdxR n=1 Tax=Tistrella mobilis TaxID=171437 RepID=UPI003556C790